MRLLLITHSNPDEVLTGVTTYVRDLADGLVEAGHDVTHLYTGDRSWRPSPHLRWGTFRGRRTASVVNSTTAGPIHGNRLNYEKVHPTVEALLHEVLLKVRPDLIHVHDLLGLPSGFVPSARRHGFSVVVTLHDFWPFCQQLFLTRPGLVACEGSNGGKNCARYCIRPRRGVRRILQYMDAKAPSPQVRRLLRRCIRGARVLRHSIRSQFISLPPRPETTLLDAALAKTLGMRESLLRDGLLHANLLIAVSAFVKSLYVRHNYPADSIRVMPLSTKAGTRIRWRHRAFRGYPLRFGYLGKIVPYKGAHVLASAARAISPEQAQFFLHGPVEEEDRRFLSSIAGDPGHLQFKGSYAHDELDVIFQEMDVLVFPSIVPETQGLVGLEAQAAGLPIIGASHGAIPEYVHHNVNGLLFSPGSVSSLRAQLLRVIQDPDLIARLSSNVRPPKPMDEHVGEVVRAYEEAKGLADTTAGRS